MVEAERAFCKSNRSSVVNLVTLKGWCGTQGRCKTLPRVKGNPMGEIGCEDGSLHE